MTYNQLELASEIVEHFELLKNTCELMKHVDPKTAACVYCPFRDENGLVQCKIWRSKDTLDTTLKESYDNLDSKTLMFISRMESKFKNKNEEEIIKELKRAWFLD